MRSFLENTLCATSAMHSKNPTHSATQPTNPKNSIPLPSLNEKQDLNNLKIIPLRKKAVNKFWLYTPFDHKFINLAS